ncbi:hypothetical protein [Pseudobacteriovorax antillogorgiicola]|uniref:hypothetical protein n=1 Tax=Pseudobacteriovorax antillogorgiicola TaxID=1513793 RepID=UPI00104C0236|nr:hypothetical protein [Pseudobacteriovorax antillogorgiicola]
MWIRQELLVDVIVVRRLFNVKSKSDMTSKASLFKYKQFRSEISFCVSDGILRYALTYRDLTDIMAERGLPMAHTTIVAHGSHMEQVRFIEEIFGVAA